MIRTELQMLYLPLFPSNSSYNNISKYTHLSVYCCFERTVQGGGKLCIRSEYQMMWVSFICTSFC